MTLWFVNMLRNLKVNAKNLASLSIKATTMKKLMCKRRELWLLSVKYMTLSGGLVCRYCEKSPTACEKVSAQPVSVTFVVKIETLNLGWHMYVGITYVTYVPFYNELGSAELRRSHQLQVLQHIFPITWSVILTYIQSVGSWSFT